ncbi:MAG: thiolase domain-containing protein [Patescibacteria group bacterium]
MKTHLIGYYTTTFGELWDRSLYDLVEEAALGVIRDTGLELADISAIFYGNMLSGIIENNVHATGKIAEVLNVSVPIYRTEAACASGGMAFQMAHTYLQAYPDKTVLVLGAEKMTDIGVNDVTEALSAAASGEEQAVGMTFPGLYGMLAQYYLRIYGYREEDLAAVAVKNHYHGTLNDKAQFRREVTIDQVMKSTYIARPLKMLDSSPISDGASAVLLTNNKSHRKDNSVSVLSSQVATDSISLKHRKRLDGLDATKQAAIKAFSDAKLRPSDIQVAELHDCFTIAELLAMEDIGFCKPGEAGKMVADQQTQLGKSSSLVINSSGGLKASGHPVGATGIKQLGELYLQLSKSAGKRQVAGARYGLAQNVGGSGGTAVVTILASDNV